MHTDSIQPGDSEHARVLRLVRRHGFNATAFQTLEQGYRHTFIDDDACVAYVDTGRAWVVAGAPLAAPERLRAVTSAFLDMARAARRRCCFFATEPRFLEATGGVLHSLRLGEQPVWDPREWASIVQRHRSLREQLRRARAKGVVVRELGASDLPRMHSGITALAERWKATRKMAPMGFLVQLAPFDLAAHRRYFVAEREGKLLGFAALVPVPARAGWFVDHLVRDPCAPNGTSELMIDAAMRGVAASGCDWLTLGMAPLAGDVTPTLRAARRGGAMFYDFEGLHAYKAKLRPEQWTPLHLSYPTSQGVWISVLDVLSAFARGGLLRFALRSLRHGAPGVLPGLMVLLVSWTLLLALVPTTQALPWGLPRAHGVFDFDRTLVCAGPALVAAASWGALRNRLRRG